MVLPGIYNFRKMAENKSTTKTGKSRTNGQGTNTSAENRLTINKTYKLYVGGRFPRTESGRYVPLKLSDGAVVNICQSSRKDLRDAVVYARSALVGWSAKSAYNRSQILYRIAELLEGRKKQFIEDLKAINHNESLALGQTERAIDTIIYYAGWCDKYSQVFSSVNPVSSPHFNFSAPEPIGVVSVLCGTDEGMVGIMRNLLPVLAGGNTAILQVPIELAPIAIDFAEVVHASDVPAGVINILTGYHSELLPHFGSHLDINAVVYADVHDQDFTQLQSLGANHVLRIVDRRPGQRREDGPYQIMDTQEIKTTWHPIGR